MRNKLACIPDFRNLFTNRGSETEPIYDSHIDESGIKTLREVGTRHIKKEIASHAIECDINVIISKLNRGDTSVINVHHCMYGDFTDLPKSPVEALQLVNDAKARFDAFPADFKAKFDNDFGKWFVSAGSQDWFNAHVKADYNDQLKISEQSPVGTQESVV